MTAERVQPPRVPFGRVYAHSVTRAESIELIMDRIASGLGGFVVTPNVDHICIAEHDQELRSAYGAAFLALPDGMPLLWMAKAYGSPLPEKVSGSDLVLPLLQRAARDGRTVFFLGATDSVCREAARRLGELAPGLSVVGWDSPRFDPGDVAHPEIEAAIGKIEELRPHLLLVALGNPKQEYVMLRYLDRYRPAVALGIGASLDFFAGTVSRAPDWMSRRGLEWLYRLVQEPGRLWRRYLVRDRAILGIFLRTRRAVRAEKGRRTHGSPMNDASQ